MRYVIRRVRNFVDDFAATIAASSLVGVLWSVGALLFAVMLDLDASWFDADGVSMPVLLARIASFWPVWAAVHLEEGLEAAGVSPGGTWPLVVLLTGAVTAAIAGLAWCIAEDLRFGSPVDRTNHSRYATAQSNDE